MQIQYHKSLMNQNNRWKHQDDQSFSANKGVVTAFGSFYRPSNVSQIIESILSTQ